MWITVSCKSQEGALASRRLVTSSRLSPINNQKLFRDVWDLLAVIYTRSSSLPPLRCCCFAPSLPSAEDL